MRDRRLGEIEEGDQLADADLAGVPSQHVDELQSDRVAQGLGDLGHPDRLIAIDLGIDDRLTARLAGGTLCLRGQLQVDRHRYTSIDSNYICQCNNSVPWPPSSSSAGRTPAAPRSARPCSRGPRAAAIARSRPG